MAVAVAMSLAGLPGAAVAAPEDDLASAQAGADRAAQELADAQEQLAKAQDAVAHVQTRVTTIDGRVGLAREQVRALAVRLYVEGTVPVVRILRMADANQVVRAQQYSHVVAGASTDSLREYRVVRDDLRRELTVLEQEQESHAESLENLDRRREEAIAEIDRLGRVVARAQAAREAEREAEAAAFPSVESLSAARSASPGSPGSPSSSGSPGPTPGSPAVPVTPAPGPPEGGPDEPDRAREEDAATGDWICPVQGPHAFSNDYGASRGGGYSHQGNDILAPRGTPVVASVDGEVRHRSGAVSGLAYYLDGDDGIEYFGAHLDSYGDSGRVSAGTVVGYVGNTGDAASTAPHLHFEMHPGGNGNVNPYSTLSQYC